MVPFRQEDGNLSLPEEIADEQKQDSPLREQPSGGKKVKKMLNWKGRRWKRRWLQPQRRHSKRLEEQGLDNLNVADMAQALKAKQNLEGKSLNSKNSFAVLNNSEIVSVSSKMGVDTSSIDMNYFDILKDLEIARHNLVDRNCDLVKTVEEENEIPLPPWRSLKLLNGSLITLMRRVSKLLVPKRKKEKDE